MSGPSLEDLVRSMREAQKRFFRDRRPEDLASAREWEKRVDQALEPKEPGLFDGPGS